MHLHITQIKKQTSDLKLATMQRSHNEADTKDKETGAATKQNASMSELESDRASKWLTLAEVWQVNCFFSIKLYALK